MVSRQAHLIRVALIVALALTATHAQSQDSCERAHGFWLRQCEARTGVSMRPVHCLPGKVIVVVGDGKDASRVEVGAASERAFRCKGSHGASPIGQFPDWSAESPERQHAFDALVSCLDDAPSFHETLGELPSVIKRYPWLLLGFLGILMVMVGAMGWGGWYRRCRGQSWSARFRDVFLGKGPSTLVALALLSVGTWVFRILWMPMRFFHQNGQGPFWIEAALPRGEFSYGPGYAEVLGWVAGLNPSAPEKMVFGAMSLAGALVPAMVWVMARESGSSRLLAWVLAVWAGLHPLLTRLSHSESYLAAQHVLVFGGATLLMWASGVRRSRWIFPFAVLGAGLVLSQAARIHPTSWLPVAVVPLVLLVKPGGLRKRVFQASTAFAGIACVVGITSLGALWGVVTGPVGQQWSAPSLLSFPRFAWVPIAVILLVVAARGRFRAHGILTASVGASLLFVVVSGDLLGRDTPWIADAYRVQWLPVVLAAGVTSLGIVCFRLNQGFVAPITVGIFALAMTLYQGKRHSTIPTDVLEQSWALEWRDSLPSGTTVAYLERAKDRIVMLPLVEGGSIQRMGLTSEELPFSVLQPGMVYYRSSLCSTVEGAAACWGLERTVALEKIGERQFPAVASLPWTPLGDKPIVVSLYRVERLMD
jgi:hypothetical protein